MRRTSRGWWIAGRAWCRWRGCRTRTASATTCGRSPTSRMPTAPTSTWMRCRRSACSRSTCAPPAWTSWPRAPTSGCSASFGVAPVLHPPRSARPHPARPLRRAARRTRAGRSPLRDLSHRQAVRLRHAGLRPDLPARRRARASSTASAWRRSKRTPSASPTGSTAGLRAHGCARAHAARQPLVDRVVCRGSGARAAAKYFAKAGADVSVREAGAQVRVSPALYNTADDIDRFLTLARAVVGA